MNLKHYLIEFALIFAIVLVVNVLVSFLYGLIVHGTGTIEWESAIALAVSLGIALPWIHRQDQVPRMK